MHKKINPRLQPTPMLYGEDARTVLEQAVKKPTEERTRRTREHSSRYVAIKKGVFFAFACAALGIALFRLPPLIVPQEEATQGVVSLLRFWGVAVAISTSYLSLFVYWIVDKINE